MADAYNQGFVIKIIIMSSLANLKFIGLNTEYPTASGQMQTRLHLDGAASPLAAKVAIDAMTALLPHYSNSHSYVHSSAQISTKAMAWAHDTVLSVLGAKPEDYTAIFTGSGATAGINRVARGLSGRSSSSINSSSSISSGSSTGSGSSNSENTSKRNIVLVSAMEHHANDLPHRQFANEVIYLPLTGEGKRQGAIDLDTLRSLCAEHQDKLNYVAVSSISNVTGIRNPIKEICEIAHEHEALVLVDGAQSVAHQASELSSTNKSQEPDFFIFSGHKVYTPMSPGVLVAKKSVLSNLSGQDLGGGSVQDVTPFDYQLLSSYPDKEQSGTPNIVGAVALAKVLSELNTLGFETIQNHALDLMTQLLNGLAQFNNITVYGDLDQTRCGALSFNHKSIDHGLLAAILNDYYAIAVRNECFCAHPYVSSLLKQELWELDLSDVPENQQESFINRKRGMVRASLSLYNTQHDIQRLIYALTDIENNIDNYLEHYEANDDGSYTHIRFSLQWQQELGL